MTSGQAYATQFPEQEDLILVVIFVHILKGKDLWNGTSSVQTKPLVPFSGSVALRHSNFQPYLLPIVYAWPQPLPIVMLQWI